MAERPGTMATRKELYEALQARHSAEHRDAERDTRNDLLRTSLWCAVWCVLGLIVFAFAFHTRDAALGPVFYWAANVVTYSGIVLTVARAYRRGEKRGDW